MELNIWKQRNRKTNKLAKLRRCVSQGHVGPQPQPQPQLFQPLTPANFLVESGICESEIHNLNILEMSSVNVKYGIKNIKKNAEHGIWKQRNRK